MVQDMTRVSEIMTRDVIHTITEETSASEAARQMKTVHRGCLIIVKGGRPVGIITERDMVQRIMAVELKASAVKISEVMSKPLIYVGPEALVTDAARIMSQNKIRRLPVVDGMVLVGMITVTDFAKYLSKKTGSDPMLSAMSRAAQALQPTSMNSFIQQRL